MWIGLPIAALLAAPTTDVELCNTVWPPKGVVLIDGPANLRDQPNGTLIVELAGGTEASVAEARGSWVRIRGEQAGTPFAGWTHETNINLVRACADETPKPVEVSIDGLRVSAFGHTQELLDHLDGEQFVFATHDRQRPVGFFVDATDMTAGSFFLIGSSGIDEVPSLSKGRRRLLAVKRDGQVIIHEDFHCLMLGYRGRVRDGHWTWTDDQFLGEFVKQTIREHKDGCYAWSKPTGGTRIPLSPGTAVRLLGVTTDAARIEMELSDGTRIFLPAGNVSWRCLSRLACAG